MCSADTQKNSLPAGFRRVWESQEENITPNLVHMRKMNLVSHLLNLPEVSAYSVHTSFGFVNDILK